MKAENRFGLTEEIIKKIISVIRKNKDVEEIILYGSRAKGCFKQFSDIDLTLTGDHLRHTDLFTILNEIDELNLPYEIDLSLKSEIDNNDLLSEINTTGHILT